MLQDKLIELNTQLVEVQEKIAEIVGTRQDPIAVDLVREMYGNIVRRPEGYLTVDFTPEEWEVWMREANRLLEGA